MPTIIEETPHTLNNSERIEAEKQLYMWYHQQAAHVQVFRSFDQRLYQPTARSASELEILWTDDVQDEIEAAGRPNEMFVRMLPLSKAPRVVGSYTPHPQPVTCAEIVDPLRRYTVFRVDEEGTNYGFAAFYVRMDAEQAYATEIIVDRLFVGDYEYEEQDRAIDPAEVEFRIMPPAFCLTTTVVVNPRNQNEHIGIRYQVNSCSMVRRQVLMSPLLHEASDCALEFIDWLSLVVADPEYYRIAHQIAEES
ncbi:hypothetical protein [Planktotalea sp.]|uniref:hypothetical protein n=1 Tax=Planktotalea sp. TaxID=2029877 RepID=UPI0032993E91